MKIQENDKNRKKLVKAIFNEKIVERSSAGPVSYPRSVFLQK